MFSYFSVSDIFVIFYVPPGTWLASITERFRVYQLTALFMLTDFYQARKFGERLEQNM
jgi:hypothetical protein